LQDYADCPRRFQLRYLLQLAWPALAAEPADEYEAQTRDGETFHRLAQQHTLGIIPWQDQPQLDADPLAEWWRAYLADPPADLPAIRLPEITLSAPLGDHRLSAKYDLLALDPGEAGEAALREAAAEPAHLVLGAVGVGRQSHDQAHRLPFPDQRCYCGKARAVVAGRDRGERMGEAGFGVADRNTDTLFAEIECQDRAGPGVRRGARDGGRFLPFTLHRFQACPACSDRVA
jgi:hypothetical protein